jgi:hypothetical protein
MPNTLLDRSGSRVLSFDSKVFLFTAPVNSDVGRILYGLTIHEMWVRKSETEIQQIVAQKEADKRNLIRPLLFAAAITVVVVLLYLFGLRGRAQGFVAQQPDGLNWRLIVAGLFLFALFAGVATYRQRKQGRILGGASDILRCRDCKELEHVKANKSCSVCGGEQEPSDFFRWVEDDHSGKP